MTNQKNNLPDLNELSTIAKKLYTDVKRSVTEIMHDYKTKRAQPAPAKKTKASTTTAKKSTDAVVEKKKVEKK